VLGAPISTLRVYTPARDTRLLPVVDAQLAVSMLRDVHVHEHVQYYVQLSSYRIHGARMARDGEIPARALEVAMVLPIDPVCPQAGCSALRYVSMGFRKTKSGPRSLRPPGGPRSWVS
jgi:hypothetical protein